MPRRELTKHYTRNEDNCGIISFFLFPKLPIIIIVISQVKALIKILSVHLNIRIYMYTVIVAD